MKKILILMAAYCLCNSAFGQERLFDLFAKATLLKTSEIDSLKSITDLDVFGYFNLQEYKTELQKATFKNTEEYNLMLEELKRKKKKLLTTTYFIAHYALTTDMMFSGYSVSTDYDMKKKGVSIIGTTVRYYGIPKLIGGVLFRALPTEWKSIGEELQREYLFLPVSEKFGLEVEAARDEGELGICYFFTIDGTQVVNGIAYLKADKVRVVLANIISGKTYSNKVYTYKTSTAKKTNVKK